MDLVNIRKYLLEENLEIKITPKYIDITNYKEISHFDDNHLIIYHESGYIDIKGKSLSVVRLMDKEIIIVGKINNIELR